ncbi:MAG: flavin reductase family protein [Bryobacterales bacterium]|nr:flavin reductase family protein [Bryobacteraceae bacterium]MDW8354315.1 flavin reductase family protein [Bryobacterales bacterium]
MPFSAVNRDSFRRACAKFPTGVAIATVNGADGAPHGLTVNSFTSVSLSPPLVLICVDHAAAVLRHFRAAQCFGINVLRESQRELSVHFARKGHDRFDGMEWTPGATGAPLLAGVLASLECVVEKTVEAGDHTIFIGKVVAAAAHPGRPLVYYESGYHTLG